MKTNISYQIYLKWSFLGGFVGSILMVLFMSVAGMLLGTPKALLLRALGVGILGINPANFSATMLGGLIIHLVNGTLIISSVLLAITLIVKRGILIKNAKQGLLVGLLAGFFVYVIFGIAMLYLVMAPAAVKTVAFTMHLQGGMTPIQVMPNVKAMLMTKIGYVAIAFLFAHLIYGATWGALTGLGASRKGTGLQFKCESCGASFNSQEELMDHAKRSHAMPAR